jgi:molybdate transport system substrate-binding protein
MGYPGGRVWSHLQARLMHPGMLRSIAAAILGVLLAARSVEAADVHVAVAANFARPMQRIAADFEKETGHHVVPVTGATGTFLAQIESGAPFEVLLAADRTAPEKLEADGLGVPGSRFTYALGTLVLWSSRSNFVDAAGEVLRKGSFQHIAIANPKLAPYGAAAVEAMGALGVLDALRPKLVLGESIAQAYQFVASDSAELGFVALSQVVAPDASVPGSYWVVPPNLFAPIRQDAVLLRRGAQNAAARALCEYLKGPKAKKVIAAFGYQLPAASSTAAKP